MRDLRDRALISTLTYSFARITAALKMTVEDLRSKVPAGKSSCMKKAAGVTQCPAIMRLPRRYAPTSMPLASPEIAKASLFRTSPRHNATVLTEQPMTQADAWRMIRRRTAAASIMAPIGKITRSARPASPPLSVMAARSSTPNQWPHTKARARPSFTIARRIV